MISPTLNINGTSADDLIAPRVTAHSHLAGAIEALQAATPNGRDYPGDSDRCLRDREAHYARIKALRDMQAEILAEAVAIKRAA
jgi:hypothetical protein